MNDEQKPKPVSNSGHGTLNKCTRPTLSHSTVIFQKSMFAMKVQFFSETISLLFWEGFPIILTAGQQFMSGVSRMDE